VETLDWSIFLADIASEVTLIHRRNEFRGALDSVESTGIERFRENKTNHPAEVVGLNGAEHIESIVLNENEAERTIPTDYFIPLGLTPS
jgi:thioredoxin reductase (NADPH)